MKSLSTRVLWTALVILLITLASTASAQDVPPLLSHQGRLFAEDNTPLSGPQSLTFRVYDAADDTGVELWSETVDVTTANGYYSVVLGQTAALPDTVFDGSTRYLGVTVGDATVIDELTPRLEVTSVAYALKSAVAENAIGDLTPTSIQVGGADIASDGTITLGAATINTDGSIVVGNTTINPDGSISVAGNPVIGADGAVDSSAFSGATLSDLETGGCATGQLVQFDAVAGWSCVTPAQGTVYTAGAGLTLSGTQFSVDPAQVQTRVSGACIAGEFMLGVNEDGSVSCAVDHTYSGGAGVVVTPSGTDSTIAIDPAVVQQRVSGACTSAEKITAIAADGTVTCETDVDADTTYSAGAGVDITGTTISLIDTVDDDTTYSAGAGVDITGTTISLIDTVDDDTTYSAGSGLNLDGGTNTFSLDAASVQAPITGSCVAGESIRAIAADGSVTCEVDTDTTYSAGAGIDITGGAIALIDTVDDDTTYTAGAGVDITGTTISLIDAVDDDTTYSAGAGVDITGTTISLIDPVDDDTTYTAGTGLTLSGTQFNVNTNAIQARVTGTCAATQKVLGINLDGTVSCGSDSNTTYTAGTGLTLSGAQFSANTSYLQRRVSSTCAVGSAIRAIAADGSVTCETDTTVVHRQINAAAPVAGTYSATRYVVDATPARVGRVVRLDVGITDELCRDDDGCDVVIGMVNWDGTGNVASRGYHLFYSQTSGSWRFENNDVSGVDNNSGLNEWTPWDCYFTDAETSTNGSNGRADSARGFGLLNVIGGSYSDATTTCRVIIQD